MATGEAWERVYPRHAREFAKAVNLLNKTIEEVREYEPDAQYYLDGSGVLNLMVGDHHEGAAGAPRQDLIAFSWSIRYSDGGDW